MVPPDLGGALHLCTTKHHNGYRFRKYTLDELSALTEDTLTSHIRITADRDRSKILKRHHAGRLPNKTAHGYRSRGASVALAKTLGSIAAHTVVNREEKVCVGLEINANHIRSASRGIITGVAKPLHLGSSSQVWSIEMFNDRKQLTCISRITMAVLDRKKFKRKS